MTRREEHTIVWVPEERRNFGEKSRSGLLATVKKGDLLFPTPKALIACHEMVFLNKSYSYIYVYFVIHYNFQEGDDNYNCIEY